MVGTLHLQTQHLGLLTYRQSGTVVKRTSEQETRTLKVVRGFSEERCTQAFIFWKESGVKVGGNGVRVPPVQARNVPHHTLSIPVLSGPLHRS